MISFLVDLLYKPAETATDTSIKSAPKSAARPSSTTNQIMVTMIISGLAQISLMEFQQKLMMLSASTLA
jgi:hypothetical protein